MKPSSRSSPSRTLDVDPIIGCLASYLWRPGYRAAAIDYLRELEVAAEGVCHSHLLGRAAFGFEELRVADEDADASRARGGDVQPVAAEEELHAVRRFLGAGGRHGINDDGSL